MALSFFVGCAVMATSLMLGRVTCRHTHGAVIMCIEYTTFSRRHVVAGAGGAMRSCMQAAG